MNAVPCWRTIVLSSMVEMAAVRCERLEGEAGAIVAEETGQLEEIAAEDNLQPAKRRATATRARARRLPSTSNSRESSIETSSISRARAFVHRWHAAAFEHLLDELTYAALAKADARPAVDGQRLARLAL